MKDAVATMGAILPDDVSGRDAVHVAVISAKASIDHEPGEHVGMIDGSDLSVFASATTATIGIVDPFLMQTVRQGQRFWLYLYPRTITSLRHHWTHPAFKDGEAGAQHAAPSQKAASEAWLKDFTSKADCPGYHRVMGAIEEMTSGYSMDPDQETLHFDGVDAHGAIPDEFWTHAEAVLGHPIKKRPKYFSCAC